MATDFAILGELEVRQEGDRIELGSPRQRALLARLLVNPNEVITTDRLVEDLWRGDPPDRARHTLHVYVSRLRKALGRDGTRLERQASGYRFRVEQGELDALRFEGLAAAGRAALARHDAATAATQIWTIYDEVDFAFNATSELTRFEPGNVVLSGSDYGISNLVNLKYHMNGRVNDAAGPFAEWLGRSVHMSGNLEGFPDQVEWYAPGVLRIN